MSIDVSSRLVAVVPVDLDTLVSVESWEHTCGTCRHTVEKTPKFCPECGDEWSGHEDLTATPLCERSFPEVSSWIAGGDGGTSRDELRHQLLHDLSDWRQGPWFEIGGQLYFGSVVSYVSSYRAMSAEMRGIDAAREKLGARFPTKPVMVFHEVKFD